MANALVVFESMFGNTEAVARSIADGLSHGMQVEVLPVASAPPGLDVDLALLVVGGPTHAFGMSRASTRQDAVRQGAHPSGGPTAGLREWLAGLDHGSAEVAAVAFDTRVKKRGMPGSAARRAQHRLRRLGFRMAGPTRSFWVTGTPGPLLDGELEQARTWGAELAAAVTPSAEGTGPRR